MIKKETHLKEVKKLYKKLRSSEKVAKVISKKYGVELSGSLSRKIRTWVAKEGSKVDDAIEKSKTFIDAVNRGVDCEKDYYIISWAQNQTDIHVDLFNNMKALSKHLNDCPIIIIPGRYRNPTSLFSNRDYDDWDERVKDYLVANRQQLYPELKLLADIKVSATTSKPLSRKQLIAKDASCIVGHPRQHCESMVRMPSEEPKMMYTTGAITLPNYTDTDIGKISHEHHVFGFLLVEKDGDTFHTRQISATDDGNFIDMKYVVENGEVRENKSVSCFVLGDVHVGKQDKKLIKEIDRLVSIYKPEYTVIHDIADMVSARKHTIKDPISEYLLHKSGEVNIHLEIEKIKKWCRKRLNHNLVVVASNHNDHLDQYIRSIDWRKDPINGFTYTKYAQVLMEEKAPKGLIAYELDQEFKGRVKTLSRIESFKHKGWELSLHGDLGANGARGSNITFNKLTTKAIKGHDHTIQRIDGVISCGTCTEYFLGYNTGLTTWVKGIAVVFDNGKAQTLVWKNGRLF